MLNGKGLSAPSRQAWQLDALTGSLIESFIGKYAVKQQFETVDL
jgi:hypothetical protein